MRHPDDRRPLYQIEGWRPAGRGFCICPGCGAKVSTMARARRMHEKRCAPCQAIPLHERRVPGSVRAPRILDAAE